ncbi:MAG: cobyric acid synthase [Deferribacteraceae bacterium]|jgi:adenosylcobyric acid synthase|nr:cobyric acid synthase [Deferribacteraceae bacterium]
MAKSIMIAGTSSGVGKSLLTAGLCRYFADRGYKTAPFKAQNMSLNSGKTDDGEISRAQILQAKAARTLPVPCMNPIILKPLGDNRSMLIRMGKEIGIYSAKEYYAMKEENFKVACAAFQTLASEYDVIVLEGAGSPAEINLLKDDIANMRMAAYAGAGVIITGDISRGGVFAALKGTVDLVEEQYRPLIKGFLINKFRGDSSILASGTSDMESMTGIPVLGVLPWFNHLLEEEDSLDITTEYTARFDMGKPLRVGIFWMPHMSGYSLFPTFRCYRNVSPCMVRTVWDIAGCDLLVVPDCADMKKAAEYWLAQPTEQVLSAVDIPVLGIGGGENLMQFSLYRMWIESADNLNDIAVAEKFFRLKVPEWQVKDDPNAIYDEQWGVIAKLFEDHVDMEKIIRILN